MILLRPTGMVKLRPVYEIDLLGFSPRLPEQPILNLLYARQIARDRDTRSCSFAGYVSRFEAEGDYASRFDRHVEGRVGMVRGAWSEAYRGVPLTIKA